MTKHEKCKANNFEQTTPVLVKVVGMLGQGARPSQGRACLAEGMRAGVAPRTSPCKVEEVLRMTGPWVRSEGTTG